MRYYIDEKTGCRCCEPDCCDEWLRDIWMIGVDYDGFNTVDGLKSLVDELIAMSQKARECLHNGRLFPTESENPMEQVNAPVMPTGTECG